MEKRNVLWWMLVSLLITSTFVSMSINIAIVSMVKRSKTSTTDVSQQLESSDDIVCPNTSFILRDIFGTKNSSESTSSFQEEGFDWTEAEQNKVLSGYLRLNYLVILPGGILAHRYGSKVLLGWTIFIISILSSLIPVIAVYGPEAVAWLRSVQGLLWTLAGQSAVFSILGKWSPPQERGKFGAIFLVGIAVGETLGSLVFGYIAQYVHWKYVFHLTSICGIIWSAFWYTLVYDSPAQHPTISTTEKEYIESSLSQTSNMKKAGSIPWKDIITSVPLILCLLAVNSGMWSFVMLNMYSPLYLKTIYGMNSNEIGIASSLPYFTMLISAFVVAHYADSFVKSGRLSITQVRKLCTLLGSVVGAIPLILISFTKCNLTLVIIYTLLARCVGVFDNFGAPLGVLDLSPKFCGVMEGIVGTSSALIMFLLSTAVNYFTEIWDIESMWKALFLFTGIHNIFTNSLYIIFGTSEVQPWNFKNDDLQNAIELQKDMKTLAYS